MAAETVLRVGPINDSPASQSVYLLIGDSGEVIAEARANDDVAGVRALSRDRVYPPVCEPSLSEAAGSLGLQVVAPTCEQNNARADVALELARSDLPRTDPPSRRWTFLQGLGALLGSPSAERLGAGQTALISVSGVFEGEHYDVGLSLAGTDVAPLSVLSIILTDFAAPQIGEDAEKAMLELKIKLVDGPPFLVEALRVAFDLGGVPQLEATDQAMDGSALRRFGPALGAAFFGLADLYSDEDRRTVLYEETNSPMQLRVSAGFGLADAGEIF